SNPQKKFFRPALNEFSTATKKNVHNYLWAQTINRLEQCGTPKCGTLFSKGFNIRKWKGGKNSISPTQ
ncbi:MAG: hypothetical protein WBP41_13560, partial [Saprospiraceae bacterium]